MWLAKQRKYDILYCLFGHLGTRSLLKLAKDQLVDGFDYNVRNGVSFCESCVEGKHHRSKFPVNKSKITQEPRDIFHSDVCGKINERSLSGVEYFFTFIDDKTIYVCVYALKQKNLNIHAIP